MILGDVRQPFLDTRSVDFVGFSGLVENRRGSEVVQLIGGRNRERRKLQENGRI